MPAPPLDNDVRNHPKGDSDSQTTARGAPDVDRPPAMRPRNPIGSPEPKEGQRQFGRRDGAGPCMPSEGHVDPLPSRATTLA